MLKELTDLPAGIEGLDAVGTLTAGDYERVFAPMVHRAQEAGTRMRLIYRFGPDFTGITAGALWADAKLGLGYGRVLDGCAVVSDIEWIRKPARSICGWMPCPARVYRNAEFDDAVAWLNSLSAGGDVSARDWVKAIVGGTGAGLASLGALAISKSVENR